MIERRRTRAVAVGDVIIGGASRISVQSMLTVKTADTEAAAKQAEALTEAGCDIVRAAVADMDDAEGISRLKARVRIPVVADIHFDHRLALASVAAGADKIRINPGNIGGRDRIKAVADACADRGIPIRVGVNSGSVAKPILAKYGGVCAEGMCESALEHTRILEELGFRDIVVAIKSSDVAMTVEANALIAEKCDYPLHIGITEAGTPHTGILKGAAGIGALLMRGIGDTVRMSLTADPLREITEAKALLRALGIEKNGVEIISCPTCGRCRADVEGVAGQLEAMTARLPVGGKSFKVAVMGCAVNGPGEARGADFGIAGGDGEFLLFKNGVPHKKIPVESAAEILFGMIKEKIQE